MRTIWILPIEPFEDRYTEQWFRWFPKELQDSGFNVKTVQGKGQIGLGGGEFLSPVDTWKWKGSQTARLAELWGEIRDNDIILSLDGWGSLTTAVAYMRDTTQKKVALATFFHAGSYDISDFLARSGMREWALDIERGWIKASDIVFVGSKFHKEMIRRELGVTADNIFVSGLPIYKEELVSVGNPLPWRDRKPWVLFPHRLAPEKDPEAFERIVGLYQDTYPQSQLEFLRTKDFCQTKTEYYKALGKAKVVVSTAWQETFGIAMQEGIALGAWAVAPDRLSYPETILEGGGLYRNHNQAVELIHRFANRGREATWTGRHEYAINRISNMLKGVFHG